MFKNLGGLGNIASLMSQAQGIGARVQEINDRMRNERVTGSAGGGMVQVEVNGMSEVLHVRIEPSLIEKGEREMIEDLVPAAINQAQSKAKQLHIEALRSLADGFNFPGLDDMIAKFTGGGSNTPPA